MKDRTDSPWYPSMRLFRQERRGDWGQVFGDIKRELIIEMDARQPGVASDGEMAAPEIPVSWGELIDKITILEIKMREIEIASGAGQCG